jgi:hypothetical protein
MLKVARQKFCLFETPPFKSYWKQKKWKKFYIDGFFESFDFELIDACEIFPKDD